MKFSRKPVEAPFLSPRRSVKQGMAGSRNPEPERSRLQSALGVLREAGCRDFKILEEGDIARLYVQSRDLILFLDEERLETVVDRLMNLGYNFITLGTKTSSTGNRHG